MTGVCKFCGCTDTKPCFISAEFARDPDPDRGDIVTCAWLLEDVCTNPDCVEKAYQEARPQAEGLMRAFGLLEVA